MGHGNGKVTAGTAEKVSASLLALCFSGAVLTAAAGGLIPPDAADAAVRAAGTAAPLCAVAACISALRARTGKHPGRKNGENSRAAEAAPLTVQTEKEN